jgi:hypothetical protein
MVMNQGVINRADSPSEFIYRAYPELEAGRPYNGNLKKEGGLCHE